MNRRDFLRSGLLVAGGALAGCTATKAPTGEFLGPDPARGHRLRDGTFPAAKRSRRVPVVIVGGGVAGLSAAWQLQRSGVNDFLLLESEPEAGGNARAGESSVTCYPWGAHYLPLPTRAATNLIELLRDLGVVTGFDANGAPRYDERYLVSPPRERLFYLGKWQDGHEPRGSRTTHDEFMRFRARMDAWRHARGSDGRLAFATPAAYSSTDERFLALDRVSMRAWMEQEGFRDPRLHWYVDYACRDDFGSRVEETSAWAGIHYFAGREPFGSYDHDMVLTWPEGNAFLTRAMAARCANKIETGWLVYRVQQKKNGVSVLAANGDDVVEIVAQQAILAVPSFVATRLLDGYPRLDAHYAPWLVANLHVEALPHGHGVGPCWDNVLYDSPSVGYVIATHQQLAQAVTRSVLTYYWPLAEMSPSEGRRQLLERPHADWARLVLADLERAHPDIRSMTTRLDLWRWGHGMIKPAPGLVSSNALRTARQARGRVHFAHADLSGMSLFEEAHHWGAQAGRAVRRALG